MARSRAFHRFNRYTAKLRRRHLRAALPEPREGERAELKFGQDLRRKAWEQEQLEELIDHQPSFV